MKASSTATNNIGIVHMLHFKNLENVLTHGLLSHNEAHKRGLIQEDISMSEIQDRRKETDLLISAQGEVARLNPWEVTTGSMQKRINLHDFVSFYFNPRNPMLYKRKDMQPELVFILIHADIIESKPTDSKFAVFSDGNAGSSRTQFYTGKENLTKVDLELIYRKSSWNDPYAGIKDEQKRKKCSEVLIYPSVPVADIQEIYCPPNQEVFDYVTRLKDQSGNKVAHIKVKSLKDYYFPYP
jgi:hypothetical protein